MKEQKIKAIIKKKVNEIAQLCGDIEKDFDKDTIHDFRISVKKLRSFLRLLRMHTQTPSLKIPKKFKRIYHIAGAIRDVQLEIDTLSNKEPGMPKYLEKLHRTLERQKNEWKKYYSKKKIRKLEDRLKSIKCEPLHEKILDRFFNDRTSAIGMITRKKSPTDGHIHNARKKIKDILYTAKLAGKKWAVVHKRMEALPIKQFDKLANMIGDYHDERQMLEHISAFSSQTTDQDEKETIKHLRNKEIRKLTAKKKSIIAATKQLALPAKRNGG